MGCSHPNNIHWSDVALVVEIKVGRGIVLLVQLLADGECTKSAFYVCNFTCNSWCVRVNGSLVLMKTIEPGTHRACPFNEGHTFSRK